MNKKHIYFVPGMAASTAIFERLVFSEALYELHYIKWKNPINVKESVVDYAKRLTQEIVHTKPILIGVSFGGIIVQEMSKLINVDKVIVISSVKSNLELPKRYTFARITKLYKLFPVKMVVNIEDYLKFFIGKNLKKKADDYRRYLSVRDEDYLKWSIYSIVHWQQNKALENIIHIHGTNDKIFPIKYIKNAIEIKDGTHSIILTKAKKISTIIDEVLTC